MGFDIETAQKLVEIENHENANRKRPYPSNGNCNNDCAKKQKSNEPFPKKLIAETAVASTKRECKDSTAPHVYLSPKKRLSIEVAQQQEKKPKFIYGNYSQYYGYRNKDKDQHDIRLDVFATHCELFRGKDVLDIGCNSGMITLAVAQRFAVQRITGIDIDRGLVNQAKKCLLRQKKKLPHDNEARQQHTFPYNVNFVQGNYVLRDDVLLELEREQFDVILCLSITKWIHLNFGDAGLKQAFQRIYRQLRSGGKLILEPQPFDNYGRRKKMTDTIYANYQSMQFFPSHFTEYLLSSAVGFASVELMGVPDHCAAGFKRPIQIFSKK